MESDNNIITFNIIKNHRYGIILIYCNYNLITGNELTGNKVCFEEFECEGNIFKNNNCVTGDERIPMIILIRLLVRGNDWCNNPIINYPSNEKYTIKTDGQ